MLTVNPTVINSLGMNSPGFHVLIFFQAKPDKIAKLDGLLADLVTLSRAEPGCRYYEPFRDGQNPDKFIVIEAWDTPEQWQAHLKAPHVAKALAQIDAEQMLTQPFTAQPLSPLANSAR